MNNDLKILRIEIYPENTKLRNEYFSLTETIGQQVDKYDQIMQLSDNDILKKNEYFKNMINLLNKSDAMFNTFIQMKIKCFFKVLFKKTGKFYHSELDNIDDFIKFAKSVKYEHVHVSLLSSNFEDACKQANNYIQSQLKLIHLSKNSLVQMKLSQKVVCTLVPMLKNVQRIKQYIIVVPHYYFLIKIRKHQLHVR